MSATEFLRNVSAEEIRKASDDSDTAEDAARGAVMSGPEFIERMAKRLETDYPGLHQRITEIVEGQQDVGNPQLFLVGVWAGATMLAHDITIAAELNDVMRQFGD